MRTNFYGFGYFLIFGTNMYNRIDLFTHFMGNAQLVQEVVEHFVKHTPELINGMLSSFQQKNYSALADYAHKLSPQLHYMGAVSIVQMVDNILFAARTNNVTASTETFLRLTRDQCGLLIEELRRDFHVDIS